MAEPMLNDPISMSDGGDGVQELTCDNCDHTMEVAVTEYYSHKVFEWFAHWTCPNCNEEMTQEGWYEE